MPIHAPHLHETTLFTALKAQIISLATPLYGTYAADAGEVYDVLAYTVPSSSAGKASTAIRDDNKAHSSQMEKEKSRPSYGVALILYTGPANSPFTSWEMISCVHDQASEIEAAEVLLRELKGVMGGVVGKSVYLFSFLLIFPGFNSVLRCIFIGVGS